MKTGRWTMKELLKESTLYLTEDGDSNRIQWKPNGRQIRYYVTLGLLDKPFGGRGYGNTYDAKHLLQLLSIKRLQHQGLKLSEIQPMLAGLTEARLAELLGFSFDWLEPATETPVTENSRADTDFWSVVPPVAPPPVNSRQPNRRLLHLDLENGATLVVDELRLSHLTSDQQEEAFDEIRNLWQRLMTTERTTTP
jgi:DNA-binding transcriptional MerR regulator